MALEHHQFQDKTPIIFCLGNNDAQSAKILELLKARGYSYLDNIDEIRRIYIGESAHECANIAYRTLCGEKKMLHSPSYIKNMDEQGRSFFTNLYNTPGAKEERHKEFREEVSREINNSNNGLIIRLDPVHAQPLAELSPTPIFILTEQQNAELENDDRMRKIIVAPEDTARTITSKIQNLLNPPEPQQNHPNAATDSF